MPEYLAPMCAKRLVFNGMLTLGDFSTVGGSFILGLLVLASVAARADAPCASAVQRALSDLEVDVVGPLSITQRDQAQRILRGLCQQNTVTRNARGDKVYGTKPISSAAAAEEIHAQTIDSIMGESIMGPIIEVDVRDRPSQRNGERNRSDQ